MLKRKECRPTDIGMPVILVAMDSRKVLLEEG